MDLTYQDAHNFAKNPMGRGIDPNRQTNPEATGFVMVGCVDCFFDL